ncbi:MAG: hypothetical protein MZV63_12825 [Marinilabiliales bacterium]|nr:hypothetical protein [Marinilabiliales bacterium]
MRNVSWIIKTVFRNTVDFSDFVAVTLFNDYLVPGGRWSCQMSRPGMLNKTVYRYHAPPAP